MTDTETTEQRRERKRTERQEREAARRAAMTHEERQEEDRVKAVEHYRLACEEEAGAVGFHHPALKLDTIDLRPWTEAGTMDFTISVREREWQTHSWYPIIKLGGGSITKANGHGDTGHWMVRANLFIDGLPVYDQEHDRAYAAFFVVTDLKPEAVGHTYTAMSAVVPFGVGEEWRIYPSDPRDLMGTVQPCETKDHDAHLFGEYLPPHAPKLYRQLIGRRIEIAMHARGDS